MQLTIQDQTATGQVVDELVVDGLVDPVTVRDLIRTRVREEVARYHASASTRFAGLVRPDGAEPDGTAYRLPVDHRIDWEEQADVAERAFDSNGFFVLVDEHQPVDLDEVLALTPDSVVTFVRLVPLAGG